MSHSIRQQMHKSLFYRQWMQEPLYQTAAAGNTLSDSRYRTISKKTADAGLSTPDS